MNIRYPIYEGVYRILTLKVAGRKMNYVISFIRNTLNAKYSGIQIKE